MNTKIRVHQRPARTYAYAARIGEIPPPSYASARDTVQVQAKTRTGMACGVAIFALVQFLPDSGAHGPLGMLLGLAPALVIAGVAFPLISWKARKDEARLKLQYGRYRKR